jgi:large repetitive protein
MKLTHLSVGIGELLLVLAILVGASPAAAQSVGTFNYSNGITLKRFAIQSQSGTAPGITSAASTTFGEDVENSFTVTTTGSPTPSIAESGALPEGVTFFDNGNGTGSLNGFPSTTGTFPISFTASNGVNPNATQSFTLQVSGEVGTDTLTVTLLGGGSGTVSDDTGALDCSEVNGEQTDGSHCLVNYSAGSMVILTATPEEGSGSTFGGWTGACANSGTSPTCMVSMNGPLTATANFVSAPQSQNLTFTTGTNVVQTAGFDCFGNPNPISPSNPCTPAQGPNADAFEVQLAQVFEPFTMTVTRTEFVPTGACIAGGSVTDPTNVACRFVTFFDYGTDSSGNTIVPICDGYSNGNCVDYDIYYCVPQASGPCVPTPGQEPPPADYLNLVALKISWNNNSFVPPSPTYTGSLQRLYDDPDFAFTSAAAYGTICGQPMLIGSTPQPYSCQFEFDVTTFFDAIGAVDPSIGGTIRQFNDLVVAFPPTTPGTNPVVTPTPPSAPAIMETCVVGCTISPGAVTFVAGSGGTFLLTTTGFPAPSLALTSGTLPTGLAFSPGTGIISGTPAAGTEGSYPITITAKNAVSSVTVSFTIIVGSGLTISPATLDFGNVYLGTVKVRNVTLTNTSGAAISISNVKVGAAGPQAAISISAYGDFVALSLCPKTLATGKSCTIVVTFLAAGSNYSPKANLTITDSAVGSPQVILLSATIINPVPKLSPLSLNFGSQAVGTSSGLKSVTVTNVGTTQLTLSGLSVTGNFSLGSGTDACTSTTKLAPGAYCEIYVNFSPASKGQRAGSLKVTDNALIGTQVVLLNGNGT